MHVRAVLASTLAAALLTSCAGGAPDARPTPAASSTAARSPAAQPRAATTSSAPPSPSATASRPTGVQREQQILATVQVLLKRRAQAVLRHDKAAFLADVDPGNAGLRRRQARFFDNLTALPLQTFTLQAPGATWPSDFAAERFRRTAYIPYVEQGLQLRGFDPVPVTSNYALTFAQVDGGLRIVSDDDLADRESDRARNAPWDTTRIVVRRSKDALGIFDEASQASAGRIMSWTEQSLATVRRDVPEKWRGDVVVYALSSERLLRRMGTRFLDRAAIAFPVFDDSDNPTRRVATRVLINPKYLPRNEIEGSYLLTHEITHVALASTSAATPTWVQEGMADYVATRGADPSALAADRGDGRPGPQGRGRDAGQHLLRGRRPRVRLRPVPGGVRLPRAPLRRGPVVGVPRPAHRGGTHGRGRRGARRPGAAQDVPPRRQPAGRARCPPDRAAGRRLTQAQASMALGSVICFVHGYRHSRVGRDFSRR